MKNEIIFGIHAVKMALNKQAKNIECIYYLKKSMNTRIEQLISIAKKNHLLVNECAENDFFRCCDKKDTHQGIYAQLKQSQKTLHESDLFELIDRLNHPPLLLILDGVQDPHNLGACLRTADAAGVDAVIIPKDKSASITPVVRKVACGAAETIALIEITNLARTMQQLKDAGVWLVGGDGDAKETIFQTDLKGPLAIIAGNEGDGMRRLTKEHCDFLVKIPMQGNVDSLNVSVATGVMLFEAMRQRL